VQESLLVVLKLLGGVFVGERPSGGEVGDDGGEVRWAGWAVSVAGEGAVGLAQDAVGWDGCLALQLLPGVRLAE
jgi:hypothetical protein